MKAIDQILSLSFKSVCDRLGMKYFHKSGQEFGLFDGSEQTDGWSFNEAKGFAVDFSGKNRPSGSVFQFAKGYKSLSNTETYKWFEDNFNIVSDINFVSEFKKLDQITEKQIEYVKSRGIDTTFAKTYLRNNYGFVSTMVTKGGVGCGVFGRHPEKTGNERFRSVTGSDGDGVYCSGIDHTKDYIIVVEGLFDYMTVRQYETNVVGVRSCSSGIKETKRIVGQFDKMYIIPHKDESGQNLLTHFEKNEPYVFDLEGFESKDVNDLYMELDLLQNDSFVKTIIEGSKQQKQPIMSDRVVPYTLGLDCLDNQFGVFDKGDLVILAGFSGMGKTEFAYFVARENAKLGNKVVYYTLELSPRFLKLRLARATAGISKIDYQKLRYTKYQKEKTEKYYKYLDSLENIELIGFEVLPTLEEIKEDITRRAEKGYTVFVIDNIGNVSGDTDEMKKFNGMSQELQTLKNNLGIAIFGIHHMSKPSAQHTFKPGGPGKLRSSQKIFDCATLVLEIFRDTDPDGDKGNKAVQIFQYKDSLGGVTGEQTIYFDKGEYKEKLYSIDEAKF